MKKRRKPKPKHKRASGGDVNAGAAPSMRNRFSRHADAPGWDHLLTRTPPKTAARGAWHPAIGRKSQPRVAALGYSDDERSALALLLLPFVIMAVAMAATQAMKSLHQSGSAMTEVADGSRAPLAGERLHAAIRAMPRADLSALAPPPAVAIPNAVPNLPRLALTDHFEPLRDTSAAAMHIVAASPLTTIAAPTALLDSARDVTGEVVRPAPAGTEQAAVAPQLQLARGSDPDAASLAPNASSAIPALRLDTVTDLATASRTPADEARLAPAAAGELLAALLPPAFEFEALARDLPELTQSPSVSSRSICEAPPANSATARKLPGLVEPQATADAATFGSRLAAAAEAQSGDFVVYTDRYRRLAYPMGDVPALFGVCTDVVIRAYRQLGLDLQALVHETHAGSGDTSIDHRRVETLRRFFAVHGLSLKPSDFAEEYHPGDIVTYYRPQNRHSKTHIAIVSNKLGASGNPMIIHNRGWGPQVEDGLFVDEITGHYRFTGLPPARSTLAANSGAVVNGSAGAIAVSRRSVVQRQCAAATAPTSRFCLSRTATATASPTGSAAVLRSAAR